MPKIIPTGPEKLLGEGKIIELVAFDVEINGKTKTFEKARRPPGVRIMIIQDGAILLSREYRLEHEKYDYRIPGGKVIDTIQEFRDFNGDIGERAQEAAKKEAKEEVGVVVHNSELFHISHCGTNIEWDLYYFVTEDFEETTSHDRDDTGESDITTAWYTYEEVLQMIMHGEMSEDRSIAVLMKWIHLENNI